MKRSATAKWRGNLKQGKGTLQTESGAVSKVPYSFGMRFENDKGTNPEELIGAAYAGCFAMAMAGELEKQNLMNESIDADAVVSLEKKDDDWSVTSIHLVVHASAPGAKAEQVESAANAAKMNCPIARLLKTEISMDLHILSQPGEAMRPH